MRQSLAIIGRHVPLQITELPTGTEVLDWVVPNEWNIRDEVMSQMAEVRTWGGRFVVPLPEVAVLD